MQTSQGGKQSVRNPAPHSRQCPRPWKPARPQARDTEEGPPRTEGVAPLPRNERGGRRAAPQGVITDTPWGMDPA
ncbi:hypothetical protein C8241_00970 [Paracidovorax avenae]|nr:hypothetical protein C8241_00970 [Paracidovorax avenae]